MNYGKPTLKWDFENGEGSIGNLDKFRELDSLMRLDLLSDWISELEQEHERASEDFINYLESLQKRKKKRDLSTKSP